MKKFSKNLIWYRLVVNIFVSIVIFTFSFSSFIGEDIENETIDPKMFKIALLISLVIGIISYIILAIYQVLYYKCSGYELKENEIICVKGVLFKKKSILEYKKIHAINSKQNLIEKLFGIAVVQIDSGSTNTAHSSEIQIVEAENVVKEIITQVKAKQNNEKYIETKEDENTQLIESLNSRSQNKELESIYDFSSKRKLIYTLLNVLWILVGGLISIIVFTIIFAVLNALDQMEIPMYLMILGIITVLLIAISIIGFVFGAIGSMIAYHDFKLIRTKNNVDVSYGLITRVHNTFKHNNIKAIRITQGIIQKLFGFASIKVEVIGYTIQGSNENQNTSVGILVPLCKENEIDLILNNLLPNYIPKEREYKAKEYFSFISYNLLFSCISVLLMQIVLVIFLLFFNLPNILLISSVILWIMYAIYIVIVIIDRRLAYKNSGFSMDNGKLCIYRGSFVKEIIVIRKQNIIGIDSKTTRFRAINNIYTYKIHFKSNSLTNTVEVLNLDKNEGDKIYNLIRY